MRTFSKSMIAAFCACVMVLLAAPAMADDSITVEVRTIAASADGDDFDDALEDIRNRLERGFEGYTSFQQLDRQTRPIERDDDQDFELPTGDTLILAYNGRADDLVKLGLTLETRLSTTLRATPGSTFFQAGLNYEDATLVLAITVE